MQISRTNGTGRGANLGRLGRLLAAAVALAALLTASACSDSGQSGDAGGQGITVAYEPREGGGEGAPTNAPLDVSVSLPWRAGDNSTIFSSVGLEFLDEGGQPAVFGEGPIGPVEMKPGLDVADWIYSGSAPSKPGVYHARLTLKRLFGDGQPELVEVKSPDFRVIEDRGPPLTSGYVFDKGADLWILSTDGARERRITFFGSGGELASDPVWSPDGKGIAFTYEDGRDKEAVIKSEIRVMASDGTGVVAVATSEPESSQTALSNPSWSTDGTRLYYTVDRISNHPPATERYIEWVTPSSGERALFVLNGLMPQQLGSDGETLVYMEESVDEESGSVQHSIVRSEAGGKDRKVLVEAWEYPSIYGPRPSPDGKWIAFSAVNPTTGGSGGFDLWGWLFFRAKVAEAHGAPWDIYLVAAQGGEARRLTVINDDEARIAWLGNTTLAFMGVKGLHTLEITGEGKAVGEPVKINRGADHGGLSWHAP